MKRSLKVPSPISLSCSSVTTEPRFLPLKVLRRIGVFATASIKAYWKSLRVMARFPSSVSNRILFSSLTVLVARILSKFTVPTLSASSRKS